MNLLVSIGPFAGLVAGIAAGAVHVLTGPDHLAAVVPLSVNRRQRGWSVGLAWGAGHALGSCLLIGAAFALRGMLPTDLFISVSAFCEYLVGVLLVGLGCWGVWRAKSLRLHTHEHRHDNQTHRHVHLHPRVEADAAAVERSLSPQVRHGDHVGHLHLPAGIGCVHGLAGGGTLLWLFPMLGMPQWDLVAFVSGFAAAGVAAMALFTALVARAGTAGAANIKGFYPLVLGLSSAFAIAIGGIWLMR